MSITTSLTGHRTRTILIMKDLAIAGTYLHSYRLDIALHASLGDFGARATTTAQHKQLDQYGSPIQNQTANRRIHPAGYSILCVGLSVNCGGKF
jgi:hypothetical protein